MMSFEQLLQAHCQPQVGRSLTASDIRDQLAALLEWQYKDGRIQRTYGFRGYFDTIAFVNALAWMVYREDHHPELGVHHNRCVVTFSTHSVGGISYNDFICAAKVEALYSQRPFI
ncbi:4a-hydroxytetrahydrobiopterin dehydratase [Thiomonas sp. FB-Cd]|uniref:4a-hydroxytetrahydrobiopterin dehydratase n=1 Tax=Thiomonas sp. FB-Cd TaxID=1158292 RepID=UPI0004DF3517